MMMMTNRFTFILGVPLGDRCSRIVVKDGVEGRDETGVESGEKVCLRLILTVWWLVRERTVRCL